MRLARAGPLTRRGGFKTVSLVGSDIIILGGRTGRRGRHASATMLDSERNRERVPDSRTAWHFWDLQQTHLSEFGGGGWR